MQTATLEQTLSSFLKDCKNEYPEALKLSKNALETIYASAFGLYEGGKYEKSIRFFRFLVTLSPNMAKYWRGLAACFQMTRAYDEALNCHAQAALLDEEDPYPHWHAAHCFWILQQEDSMKTALNGAKKIANRNPERHQALLSKLKLLESNKKGLKKG